MVRRGWPDVAIVGNGIMVLARESHTPYLRKAVRAKNGHAVNALVCDTCLLTL